MKLAKLAGLAASIALLGLGWPAAAQNTLAGLYDAAKAEGGKLTIFGAPNAQVRQEILKAFNAAFPSVTVDWTGAQGNEVFAKMQSEQAAGVSTIDVILSGGTTGINMLKPAKLLQPMEPWLTLPEVTDAKLWMEGRLHWVESDKQVLAYSSYLLPSLSVNPTLVQPGAIKSAKDLLDPKWKGKIVSNSPIIPGSANIYYRLLYDYYGEDFLEQLSKQEITVINDLRQAADLTAKGRYAIAMGLSPSIINYYMEQGVKTLRPVGPTELAEKPILTSGFGNLMIPAKPAHPAAARLFVNWYLSKDGQTAGVKGFGYPSRRLDTPVDAVPEYLRPPPGLTYYQGDTAEFLTHPNQKMMIEAAKKWGLQQK